MSKSWHTVYIGLGSNLNHPQQQVRTALDELARLAHSQFIKASSLYLSAPLGPPEQKHYINAVAEIKTQLEPLVLLNALQAIEQAHQRVRQQHWGSRTLDLDILLYGDKFYRDERLTIPHAHMAQRLFVLQPLAEIAPCIEIPGQGNIQALLVKCPDWELQLVA
jgi:2-amino-4-hydroxy-6-hydroxymethyldihydropteridine diphosphokinase